ncbi:MAG: amidophosphoribosyltransferase [bacterium]|nr:amidophosphoribosyltransferase [bacterium]
MKEDKFKDECGIFGVYGYPKAAKLTYLGIFALQHRGQESAGIVTSDGNELISHRGMGLVTDVFDAHRVHELIGKIAIGHVRYSTTGASRFENAQPLTIASSSKGPLSICHNGNLVNATQLRIKLEKRGAVFQTTSDSEVIIQLIIKSKFPQLPEAISDALSEVKGAYSLLLMTPDELIGIRDPLGFRPLCIGRLGKAYILASETCALDLAGAVYLRDVQPGEMVIINSQGLKSHRLLTTHQPELFEACLGGEEPEPKETQCIFEFIYFARPDSKIFGENVYEIRKELGRQLVREYPIEADVVIPVPDSGVCAALGVSEEADIPYELGLMRNHYVGRTFIDPKQAIREMGVQIKLNPVRKVIENKRIIVVDDSIVRGTTCQKIMRMLHDVGAKEIHLRISSPPIKFPCFYGIDTPTSKELIAANHSIEGIRNFVNVDTLGYLSIDGLLKPVRNFNKGFCLACFNGDYPIKEMKGR